MILLFSGGLDSYIAWHFLGKPKTLYCDLGHRYAAQEVNAVRYLIPTTIIDTRLNLADQEQRDAYIPLRNAYLVMVASYYDRNICLVVQQGEMDLADRSVGWFNSFGATLSFLLDDKVTIMSPFFKMTKTDMVRWYVEHNLPISSLLRSRSCFGLSDNPCGACAACFRRWISFVNNGITEFYENDIMQYDGIQEYIIKMKKGMYDAKRTEETFSALEKVGIL